MARAYPQGKVVLGTWYFDRWADGKWDGMHKKFQQQRWDGTKSILSGGFPYSEGIYEDINKVICARLFWAPDEPAAEAVRQYAAFEFSPDVADDVVALVTILEDNHLRDRIGQSATAAYTLMQQIESRLTSPARQSWRWRLLAIRTTIDQELYRNGLRQGRPDVFRSAYEELLKISRAENAMPMLRPVLIPAVSTGNDP